MSRGGRRRLGFAAVAATLSTVSNASPAHADNCSSLSDCSWGVNVALALLAIVLAIALWYALAPLIAQLIARQVVANAILGALRANTLRHIFGKAAHGLAPLVARLGSERAVMAAVARAMARLPAGTFVAGQTFEVIVRVAGYDITVRGRVVDGIIRISTMFIP